MASALRPILRRRVLEASIQSRLSTSNTVRFASTLTSCAQQRINHPISPLTSRLLPKTQIASFSKNSRLSILPPPKQVVKGTVNDPAIVPDPAPAHGSFHWSFERFISAALIPLTIAPFASGSLHPLTDATLCALLVIHSHIGFESIIIDYVPQKRLPRARKVFMWGLKGVTLLVAIGLYEFETNDVGLTEAIKRIWRA